MAAKNKTGSYPPGDSNPATGQVISAVLQMLRSGEYRSGDRLPSEWELVERVSVGRSAIREAMRELAALGLVEIHRGRGTFAGSLRPDLLMEVETLSDIAGRITKFELLEVRLIIEPRAAALAASRATQNDLERLAHDVELLREAVKIGYKPPEDLGFHLDVIRAAHNAALSRITGPVVSYYQRDEAVPTERDIRQHNAIFKAIESGDSEAAHQGMQDHLTEEMTVMEKETSRRQAVPPRSSKRINRNYG